MKALLERKAEEMDTQTVAIAAALAISFSADALAQWRSSRGIASVHKGPMDAQTLNLMVAQFPGSFKVN
jgi:hypothetical protein